MLKKDLLLKVRIFLIFTSSLFILGNSLQAQSVGISDTSDFTPDTTALLEMRSTQRGFLMPRMTRDQRVDIDAPVHGLMVVQTNDTLGEPSGIWYYNSNDTQWHNIFTTSTSVLFSDITTATNITATMTVGTGAQINLSGTGIVESNKFLGSGSTSDSVDLNTAEVGGILPVAKGGTGVSTTPPAGGAAYGNGSTIAYTAAGTAGQVLVSDGTNPPSWQETPLPSLDDGKLWIGNGSNLAIENTVSGDGTLSNAGVLAVTKIRGTLISATAPTDNQILKYNSSLEQWVPVDLAAGGTVTSVGLALPTEFTVSGSPVIGSGTLTGAWANQNQNLVFSSPDGSSGTPSFRALVSDDIPNLDAGKITTGTFTASQIPSLDAGKITTGIFPVSRGGTGVGTVTANGLLYGNGTDPLNILAPQNSSYLTSTAGGVPQWSALPGGGFLSGTGTSGQVAFYNGTSTLTGSNDFTWNGTLLSVTGNLTATGTTTLSGLSTAGIVKNSAAGVLSTGTVDLTTNVNGILPVANGGTNSGTALNNNRIMVSSAGAIVEAAALTNGQFLIGSTGAAPVAANITAASGSGVAVTNGAGTVALALTSNQSGSAWNTLGNSGTTAGTNFIGTTDAIDLTIKTNNTEKVRVTSSGNVGIGVSPTTGKLQISDATATDGFSGIQINQTGAVSGTGYGIYATKTGSSTTNVGGYFSASGGTSNYGLLVPSGYVGIGTSTPTTGRIQITDATAIDGFAGLSLDQSGAVSGTGYGIYATKTGASTTNVGGYFSASGGTSNYGLLVPSGYVGIGTTAPTQKFELKDGNFLISNSGTTGEFRLQETNAMGTNYTGFKADTLSQNLVYTMPKDTNNELSVLVNYGTNKLKWMKTGDLQSETRSNILEIINAATYTLPDTVTHVLVERTGVSRINLYSGTGFAGKVIFIKRLSSADYVEVCPVTGQKIDRFGGSNLERGIRMRNQYDSVMMVYDGTNWWIMTAYVGNNQLQACDCP